MMTLTTHLIVRIEVRLDSLSPEKLAFLVQALSLQPAQLSSRSAQVLGALASGEIQSIFRVHPPVGKSEKDCSYLPESNFEWAFDPSRSSIVMFQDGGCVEMQASYAPQLKESQPGSDLHPKGAANE